MSKRFFRVTIHGYGGEIVLGRLTEEQYDFWVPFEEEQIIAHAFWDPHEESDENPIYDDGDPRWLGHWNELDDIEHVYGASTDSAYISIEEVDGYDPDKRVPILYGGGRGRGRGRGLISSYVPPGRSESTFDHDSLQQKMDVEPNYDIHSQDDFPSL